MRWKIKKISRGHYSDSSLFVSTAAGISILEELLVKDKEIKELLTLLGGV